MPTNLSIDGTDQNLLNKGQVNGFASLYLALFTLVLFALVIVYRRHSEVRS